MNKLFKKYNFQYAVLSFLFLQILIHSVYGFTFKYNILGDFEIVQQLRQGSLSTSSYSADSPIYHIGAFLLKIDYFENYIIYLTILTVLIQLLIVLKISYLKKESLLFLSAGWVVTVGWYVGNTDVLAVLLAIYLFDSVNKENINWVKVFIFSSLLTFSHYGLAFFIIFSIVILLINENKKMLIPVSIFGYLFGRLIIQFYLNSFNYSGRSRFRFLFNDNILNNTFNLTSSFFLNIILSGFLGMIMLLILNTYNNSSQENFRIYLSLAISIIGTSIALDSSRVFSVIIVPLIYYLIIQYKKNIKLVNQNLINSVPYLILILSVFIGEQHVYGIINFESPNNLEPSMYNLFTTKVNSLMKNIWP